MAEPGSALVAAIRRRLAEAADPARAPAMQAYMKSALPFHGVPADTLRRICREEVAAHPLPDAAAWRHAVLTLWDGAAVREERYAALHVLRHPAYRAHRGSQELDLYRHLVVTGAWWDLVDPVAAHCVGAALRDDPSRVAPVVLSWADDADLWLRRTAVLAQLGSKDRTDPALLQQVLERNLEDSRHGREFFIRKAVGWALREYSRTDPAWVRAFVAGHADRLSGLSRREATRRLEG